jgi:hypothetical protein
MIGHERLEPSSYFRRRKSAKVLRHREQACGSGRREFLSQRTEERFGSHEKQPREAVLLGQSHRAVCRLTAQVFVLCLQAMLVEIAVGAMRLPGAFAGDVAKVGPFPLRLVNVVPFFVELDEFAEMQAEEPGSVVVNNDDAIRIVLAQQAEQLSYRGLAPADFIVDAGLQGNHGPSPGAGEYGQRVFFGMPSFEKLPHAGEFLSESFRIPGEQGPGERTCFLSEPRQVLRHLRMAGRIPVLGVYVDREDRCG